MSMIDDVIRKHCPNGVEFKTLGEIGTLVRGNGLQKKDFAESGVGCIHYGQIYTYYKTFTDKTISFVPQELAKRLVKVNTDDLIVACTSENIEDVCKTVAWLGKDEIVTGGHATVFKHKQNAKYLAYYFQTTRFFEQKKKYARGAKVIDIKRDDLAKISLPLPPLPVQAEIVKILDKFTQLEAELEAELEARRSQYEFYRNKLLSFNELDNRGGYRLMSIGEVCGQASNIKWPDTNGESFQYIDLSSVDRDFHCVTETQTITQENAPSRAQRIVRTDDIIFGTTRPTLKRYCMVTAQYNGQICSTGFCVLRPKTEEVLPKWIYYHISLPKYYDYMEESQRGAGYPAVSDSDVKNYKIPVPSLGEQERIVGVLDKFDALVNDISVGLPAEIAARQQQYEHYRDQLLTFPHKEVAV